MGCSTPSPLAPRPSAGRFTGRSRSSAEFNPVPARCTGKFKNVVAGSLTMLAVTDPFPLTIGADGFSPPFDYEWQGDGWLQFKRGK